MIVGVDGMERVLVTSENGAMVSPLNLKRGVHTGEAKDERRPLTSVISWGRPVSLDQGMSRVEVWEVGGKVEEYDSGMSLLNLPPCLITFLSLIWKYGLFPSFSQLPSSPESRAHL